MTGKKKGTTENKLSARGVLEEIGKKIKENTEKGNNYDRQLKGTLSNAKFADRLYKESHNDLRSAPSDACSLEYKKHTNTTTYSGDGRHPCHGRKQNRFSESEEYGCSNVYIKGNENKSNGTACAPPRRRHICDQNLEFLDNNHTDDTDDLLGNVLVTAKYEGNYIVTNHPDKNNRNKSGICTSLARSFADIGDIVRGRDMFKSNENVEIGIKKVFDKIYDKLGQKEKRYYSDTYNNVNYVKLREDWWKVNRDQVWKAITCEAPGDANYFRKGPSGELIFSNKGPCGRDELTVPTYLDYVPQFLRWFEEWAEEFCRIKEIKIQNIKKSCIGEHNNKHCSGEGYNCKLTDLRNNKIYMDLECPSCADDCKSYETWVETKNKEFNKQKKKYQKEVDATQNDNKENGIYNKTFYDNLKTSYKEVNRFFELLSKGQICENIDKKIQIDYNDTKKTFSRPEYCKSCPIKDILCNDNECKIINDSKCKKIKSMPNMRTHKNENPIDIDILINVNKKKFITNELKNNYKNCDLFKKLGEQKWNCKYKCNLDVCEPTKFDSDIYNEQHISITVLFKRWLEYFLEDYNKLNEKLNSCMHNEQKSVCIKECKKNCECVEKWINIKTSEWEKVRNRYVNQYENKDDGMSNSLNKFLEQSQFKVNLDKAKGGFKDLRELEESSKCTESMRTRDKVCKKKDVIESLLFQLNKKVDECKNKHDDTNGKPCCDKLPKPLNDQDEDDEDDDEDEEDEPSPPTPPSTTNPCIKSSGVDTTKTVIDVAKILHGKAKNRSSDINKLKGDASQGTYNRSGNASDFKTKLCNINENHSNAEKRSPNPCNGKNKERFTIGKDWSHANEKKTTTYTDVYIPQRREHMCTSNLEYLEINRRPLNGRDGSVNGRSKINDSFLGDVLLAAKYEADKIKELYKSKSDNESVCRAVSRSFADIGDIIKGTDMWDKDGGEIKTQEKLQAIFDKIKDNIPGIQDKYTGPLATQNLRKDWWEANRTKVWKAMQCAIKDFNTSTGYCQYKSCDRVPLDDYIPQRLRWMTEWAEWYCKMQSQEYKTLQGACDECKGKNGQCTNDTLDCKKCTNACTKYNKKIKSWEEQWNKIQEKYGELYKKALHDTTADSKSAPKNTADKDQHVIQFLKQLQQQNGINTTSNSKGDVYGTAAGYVHQEVAPHMQCNTLTEFCRNGNGDKHAFENPPTQYKEACNCENNKQPKEKKVEEKKDACEIVKKLFQDEASADYKNWCTEKFSREKKLSNGWNCNSNIFKTSHDDGACMPPRRQNLYVHKLQKLSSQELDDLRTAFIQCSAIETFFAWNKYKEDKEREDKEENEETLYGLVYTSNVPNELDEELIKGTIRDDFKRQMFYTFGDYKDICLGKDMGKDMSEVHDKIKGVFTNSAKPDDKRKEFWEIYGKDIWKGMICALSYDTKTKQFKNEVHTQLMDENKNNSYNYKSVTFDNDNSTTLDTFVSRPQFIRWFEEWSEEFCRKKNIKIDKIINECRSDKEGKRHCSSDGYDCERTNMNRNKLVVDLDCPHCEKQCTNYKNWIQNKEKEFHKQKNKCENEIQKRSTISNNEHVKEFRKYLNENGYNSINLFLASLNQGKECQGNSKQKTKTDFNRNHQTFGPSQYCKACPVYGVKYNRKSRKCETIEEKDLQRKNEKDKNPKNIEVLVSGRKGKDMYTQLKDACKNAGLFEDPSVQIWNCQKKYGVYQCQLTNFLENIDIDKDILFNELFQRWIKDFLEGYYISNKNIDLCSQKGKNKCECIGKWVEKKITEWNEIKAYFKKLNRDHGYDIEYTVKSFFQKEPFFSAFLKAMKGVNDIEDFKKLRECTHTECYSGMIGEIKHDIITKLLENLKEKNDTCKTKPGQTPPKTCENPLHNDEENPPIDNPDTDTQKPAFCTGEEEPQVPVKRKNDCNEVKTLFNKSNGAINAINDCYPKINRNNYPGWDCKTETMNSENSGACMPPRRQILCIHDLKALQNDSSKEDLRKAFINCAAIETYFSWHYYKSKNDRSVETHLQNGKIPHEFKRIMYYTFGDYRDICLETDISSDKNIQDISKKVKFILNSPNSRIGGKNITPESWWEKHGKDIWEGMLCALPHSENFKDKNEYKVPPDDFAKRPQFLRWFVEWGDEYCHKRGELEKNVKKSCNKDYAGCEHANDSNSCRQACKEYKNHIHKKQIEYTTQKSKFDSEKNKGNDGYKSYSDKDASEYLKKKCLTGTCDCMNKVKNIYDYWDNPFKTYENKNMEKKCECSPTSVPEPEEEEPEEEESLIEARVDNMSCIERTAQELRKEAEKNIEPKLKVNGKIYHSNCKNIDRKYYATKNGEKCRFKENIWSSIGLTNNACESTGEERFKIGNDWNCDGDSSDGKNKLCIPPRRKDMCLKKFEDISVAKIKDSKTLLQKIQNVAKNEGIDIIKNLLPVNPCNEDVICDAMKYSFADLGDIIRGTDNYKGTNTEKIQENLKSLFDKIKQDTISLSTMELTEFRHKWWDANREYVWETMASCSPKNAYLKKKLNNPAENSQTADTLKALPEKCGYDKEPPDYDYIPQPYRWMQEWSEYYCKGLKEKLEVVKSSCEECRKQNSTQCANEKGEDIEKCNKCKEKCKECNDKCEEYREFVKRWEEQLEGQKDSYKKIYLEGSTATSTEASTDYVKKFFRTLSRKCTYVSTIDNYLNESTHCTDYLYPKSNSSASNYAFLPYPNEYQKACKCKEKTSQNKTSENWPTLLPKSLFPRNPKIKLYPKIGIGLLHPFINIVADPITIHENVAKTLQFGVPKFHIDPDKTDVPSPTNNILKDVLPSAIPVGIALALTSIAFLFIKKKSKSSVDLLRVLNIPKGEYEMPTLKSKNRYVPYRSGTYKGKTYIYMEGDTSGDEDKYIWDLSSSDITSSESEYEEMDINDIYVPGSPKYKTLIEVVLEPSKSNGNTLGDDMVPTTNTFKDEEWNELKHDFISQYLPNKEPNNNYRNGHIPMNTEPNTLYFDKPEEKPFITSIHDRDLYTGEEINYNINMVNNDIPMSDKNGTYTGIDLINDSLSGESIDIYDEVLKRKENELFGTKHPKRTSNNSVAKNTNSDPIDNQLNLFHTWLDRHRDMCEEWNTKEDILNKLNEEWNKDNDGGNEPNDNKRINTDVSIQIDMDDGKPKKEFTNMDTNVDTPTMNSILDDLETYNEPFYDIYEDDVYYDVNDDNKTSTDHNNLDVSSNLQIEMDVNTKLVKEKYPISDVWDI